MLGHIVKYLISFLVLLALSSCGLNYRPDYVLRAEKYTIPDIYFLYLGEKISLMDAIISSQARINIERYSEDSMNHYVAFANEIYRKASRGELSEGSEAIITQLEKLYYTRGDYSDNIRIIKSRIRINAK